VSQTKFKPYRAPAGGWGSAYSVANILLRERVSPAGIGLLLKQNKPIDGFACVSCAWAKPHPSRPLSFCENGAKATAWENTSLRCGPEFFSRHSVSELLNWSDFDLEQQGRLTHPLRYDAASDHYQPVSWDSAFAEIGAELKAMDDPDQVVFYMSGRAALETAYMYGLLARLYGTNNLPDSSNMCHESTSVALPESIGVPVATVTLNDLEHTDGLFFFGQNTGTSSPRMLHELQAARERGAEIVTFNPLRERGLERFVNPQSPREMLTPDSTVISTQYHQLAIGGDMAAIAGMCKALFAMDDLAIAEGRQRVLDVAFIEQHTHGFEAFEARIRSYTWEQLERRSGLTRAAMEAAATAYARCERVIAPYGMGLTQHRHGVQTIQMLVNLLLLRGNMGKEGAGILPVRGHSNVQGQRTVGITEKAAKVPVDNLRRQFGFEPPSEDGVNTVEACEGILDGSIRGFIGLGGNFVRAIPDTLQMEPAWQTAVVGAGVDQAQPQSPDHRRSVLYLALPRSHRDRPPGHRRATPHNRGQHRLHPGLARRRRAGWRTALIGTGDHRATGQGHARAQPDAGLGRLGRGLQSDPRRHRRELPGDLPRLQRAHDGTRRLPSPARRQPAALGHRDRQGQLHQPAFAEHGPGYRGRRPRTARRAADDDAAQQRPIQYHRLRVRRPLPRHSRHPRGDPDEPQRHRPPGPGRERPHRGDHRGR